jgi:NTE family protein
MPADAVFSGGGVKGLAFAGAVKAAEEAGYAEWVSLGGTSAEAIAAMALAVGFDAAGLRELFSFDFSQSGRPRWPLGLGVIPNYFDHRLTHGKALTDWIEAILERAPRTGSSQPPRAFGDRIAQFRDKPHRTAPHRAG